MKSLKENRGLRLALLLVLMAAACGLICLQDDGIPEEALPVLTPAPVKEQTEQDSREAAYQQDMEALTALIESDQTDEATRRQAQTRLMQMVQEHQTEAGIQQALTQAGYGPCMALCQNGALTVMLTRDSLSSADSAAILALCTAHTDISVENIRIMTR